MYKNEMQPAECRIVGVERIFSFHEGGSVESL